MYEPCEYPELTEEGARAFLISKGENPDFPKSGMASGPIREGLRHHVCEVDGHSDPDNSGLCIYCDCTRD